MDTTTGQPNSNNVTPLTTVEVNFRSRFKAVFKAYSELSKAREALGKQLMNSVEREQISGFWDKDFSNFFTERLMVIRESFHRENELQKHLFEDELQRLNTHGAEKIATLREMVQAGLDSPQVKGSNELPAFFNEVRYRLNDFDRAFQDVMGLLNTHANDLGPQRSAA